jgi:hypothetical protein
MKKMTDEEYDYQKIADDLNLSIEKVRSYWENWICKQEKGQINVDNIQSTIQDESSSQSKPSVNRIPQISGKMEAKLIPPRKAIFFWDSSDLPKQLFQYYFNIRFDNLVQVIRIYDVTQIQFNGRNAHHYYDISIPYQQGYWIVKGLFSNRCYLAEIGVRLSNRDFFPLLRSNSIRVPKLENVLQNELYQDLSQLYKEEEQLPKWREFVSTYSYYLENGSDGGEQ